MTVIRPPVRPPVRPSVRASVRTAAGGVVVPPFVPSPIPPEATRVDIVSTPQAASDTYGFGEIIRARVTWDVPVFVTGTPRFPINLGQSPAGSPDYFAYDEGSGTDEIDFIWTVAATDEDTNGIFVYNGNRATDNEFDLTNGTIRSSGGTDADPTLPTVGDLGTQSGHKVDGSLMASMADRFLWGADQFLWGADKFEWGT